MADWKTGTDGDFVLDKGSIDLTDTESDVARQNILFRLQTGLFDYDPEPELAAGLDEYIGRPNRVDVGEAIKRSVVRALTRDGQFQINSLAVEVVPLSKTTIGIYVFHEPRFTGTGLPVTVTVSFNLTTGTISLLDGETR